MIKITLTIGQWNSIYRLILQTCANIDAKEYKETADYLIRDALDDIASKIGYSNISVIKRRAKRLSNSNLLLLLIFYKNCGTPYESVALQSISEQLYKHYENS